MVGIVRREPSDFHPLLLNVPTSTPEKDAEIHLHLERRREPQLVLDPLELELPGGLPQRRDNTPHIAKRLLHLERGPCNAIVVIRDPEFAGRAVQRLVNPPVVGKFAVARLETEDPAEVA